MKQYLNVAGSLDSCQEIAAFVQEISKKAGLDSNASYKLRLAIDEITTNIVNYGYDNGKTSGQIEVFSELTEGSLVITIQDSAPPFDPRDAPPPDSPHTPLEFRKMGGWGVHFAMQAVDQFLYERVGSYNRNIFIVKRK